MTRFLDCAGIAEEIFKDVRASVSTMSRAPFLAGIRVDGDAPSATYARGIKADCARCGVFYAEFIMYPDEPVASWNKRIMMLNNDPAVDGVMIFRPAPDGLCPVAPEKDVDAFDAGASFGQCTPEAVMRVLDESGISVAGKHVVVIGRSSYIGRPLMTYLLNRDATLTVCHSQTQDLARYTRMGDVLITATGKPGLITGDMVRLGAAVVDVGVARVGRTLCGDVDLASISGVASHVTLVPNGVGLVTRAMLMEHVCDAYCRQKPCDDK